MDRIERTPQSTPCSQRVQSTACGRKLVSQKHCQPLSDLIQNRGNILCGRHDMLGRFSRRQGPLVRNQVAQRNVNFMTDCRNNWNLAFE